MQESSYRLSAKNPECGDYGIGQINHKTIKSLNLDEKKLLSDLTYSVEAAAIVLSHFKRYQKREPDTWYCRYNVGTAGRDRIRTACQTYVTMVARYM